MKITQALPLLFVALYGLAACGVADTGKTAETKTPVSTEQHAGAKVYQSLCMSCHAVADEKAAPPFFAVKNHLIKAYPDKKAFTERVVSWVKKPDANDPAMPGAVKKFGLMPAMPQVSDAELQAVAEFLYDTDFQQPDWYKAHYEAEHGVKP